MNRLICLLATICLATGALAQEPEYTYTFALGAIGPLGSAQGVTTPVVLARYAPPTDPTWWVELKTSQLNLRHRPKAGRWMLLGGAEVISAGDSGAIFLQGQRQKDAQFWGHYAYGGLGYLLFEDSKGSLRAHGLVYDYITTPDGAANPSLDLPPDFSETVAGIKGQGEFANIKAQVELDAYHRQGQEPWALEADPKLMGFRFWSALEAEADWGERQTSQAEWEAGSGSNLGVFRGFQLGGFGSTHVIPGYYRSEFRANRYWLYAMGHEVRLDGGRKLFAKLVGGTYDPQKWLNRGDSETVAGFSLGSYLPIPALSGLPVILMYGQALSIPENSPESYRREVAVIFAAAF